MAANPTAENFLARLHPNERPTRVEDAVLFESDEFFAWRLKQAGNVILAAEHSVLPHELFATNALQLGDISAEKDTDGILRRARAFKDYHHWHPAFKQVAADPDLVEQVQPGEARMGADHPDDLALHRLDVLDHGQWAARALQSCIHSDHPPIVGV